MAKEIELLTEIRDLMLLMAEPAIAKRDERLRAALLQLVGKSRQKADAVLLMDGTRSQGAIRSECGMDAGNLSRFVRSLREAKLIGPEDENLKLAFHLPQSLLDGVGS